MPKHRKLKNSELKRKTPEQFREALKTPLIVVLDNVRSLNNIGAIFRTLDAFLIEKIYLCGITATPPHKDIRKTALGATDTVVWEHRDSVTQLIVELNAAGIRTVAIEQAEQATMLHEFSLDAKEKYAIILGNEVKGVQQEAVDLCTAVVEIPQLGTKHSLNIATSVGIVLWDFVVKLKFDPLS